MYVSFGDIKGMSNIKDVEQQSCCCCCCYHGKKIYNFPFLFLCMPNGIRNCMYSSGGREERAKKSMEPSQNGNLNIFQMCFPFRTFFSFCFSICKKIKKEEVEKKKVKPENAK